MPGSGEMVLAEPLDPRDVPGQQVRSALSQQSDVTRPRLRLQLALDLRRLNRAVITPRLAPPDFDEELFAGHDPLRVGGEGDEQLQLAHRQAQRAAVDEGGVLLGTDLQATLESPRGVPGSDRHDRRAWRSRGRRRLSGREAAVNDL